MNRCRQGTFRRLFKDRWKPRFKAGLSDFSKRKKQKNNQPTKPQNRSKSLLERGWGGGKSKQNEYSAKETEKASSSMKLSNLEERPSSAQTSIENKS